MRDDGRLADELRPLSIELDYTRHAKGSVLIQSGDTRLICTAMVEDRVPPHCLGKKMGWISAEYAMLPSANPNRKSLWKGPDGRTSEIQRLIGRSLRMAVDLGQIGMRTIWIDCAVIQADGGTRTAAVTGGFVALVDALWKLRDEGKIGALPLNHGIAAVSVGVVEGVPMLDLKASEDQEAAVDMNVVMTHSGEFVELQGTGEVEPFGRERLDELLALAAKGAADVRGVQIEALKGRLAV